MLVSFIIPTYNEAENLPRLVAAYFALPVDGLRLVIVDDNSPDGTGQIADQLTAQFPGRLQVIHRAGKQGLGTAYVAGFKLCISQGAEAVGQMDADFSHPIEKIVDLVRTLEKGQCDTVIGSRYVRGGSVDVNWPIWRKGLSAWANFYARTILHLPARDVTGGFRLIRREVIQNMPLELIRSSGYVFQVETAYIMHRIGVRFQEVPIYFADRKLGKSKMSLPIQVEAAFRVWELLGMYRDLKQVMNLKSV